MPDSERIGAYRIVKRLGAGGMGEVVLAHDDRLDRDVAIKRLHAEHADTPERRERFRREARIAARLNHPAVVQIYDVLHQDEHDYLIMEYIAGHTLRERCEASALPLSEVLGISHQIALGMAAAHDLGIIHRDLKAENILITPAGRAKITDFGIAKLHGEETLTAEGAVVGTFRAMSPEQALGQEVDYRSDLFSFGILLYEALSGASPFRASTPFLTVQRLVVDEPAPITKYLPALPPRLASLVHQLLAKEPMLRPRDFHEVADVLIELAGQACDDPCQSGAAPRGKPSSPGEDTHSTGEAPPPPTPPSAVSVTAATVRALANPIDTAPTALAPSPAPSPAREPGHREPAPLTGQAPAVLDDTAAASAGTRLRPPPAGPRRRLWYGAGLAALATTLVVGTLGIRRAVRDREPADPPAPPVTPPAPPVTPPAPPAPSPLRRVAVLEPRVSGAVGPAVTARLAASIRNAIMAAVRARVGLDLVHRADIDDYIAGFRQKLDRRPELSAIRTAVGADEAIATGIACEASTCTITLDRDASRAGGLESTSFQLAADSAGRPDETVAYHLARLYPDHPLRRDAAAGAIDPGDYERYVQLARDYWAGGGTLTTDKVLAELERIRERSPRSLDVLLFEAEVLRHQSLETKDPDQAQRAMALLDSADKLFPDTYSILSARFDLALANPQLADPGAILERLTVLDPDSSVTHLQRAKLHYARRELAEARRELDAAARRDSFSWRVLYHQALVTRKLNDRAATRKAIADLLQRSPGNYAGLSLLAYEEIEAGRLACAAQIYARLVEREPSYHECIGLGSALNQLGRYREAASSLRRALAIRPSDPATLLNLAESLLLAGDTVAAGAHLRALHALMAARRRSSPTRELAGDDRLIEVQALAYLGRDDPALAAEARTRTAELLAQAPSLVDLFTAALVYAVLGDRGLAATYATRYLEAGGGPAAFSYPYFDDLRRDPILGRRLTVPLVTPSCDRPAP